MTHLPRPLVVGLSGPTYRLALNHRVPVRVQRALCEAGASLAFLPPDTQVRDVTLGGAHAERVTSGASQRPRAVLYLHGGGYVVGSARMYRALAAHLARASGSVVFTLDYRLAPEHPYPAALDDAVAAFHALVDEHGFDPSRIAVAGDSAGGGLAVATARRLIDAGVRPGPLGLLSPWTDPSDTDHPARDFVVNKKWGSACAAMYRGAADPTDPGYAPIHGRLDDLPPMLVHAGVDEMLNGPIKRFVAAARGAGAEVELVEHAKLWHSGHILAGMLREATDAVHDLGVWLRAHLDTSVDA